MFKVGDEVIVVNAGKGGNIRDYRYVDGYTFTITQRAIDYNRPPAFIKYYFAEDDYEYAVPEENLMLLSIYNSPLYKIMKEINE